MSENIDTIILGGQTLRTTGPVAGKAISEFTAGLKVGPATYDERLHAFWVSMADFSGGVGYRQEDIRQETGVVWDNSGGVDIRRAANVLLPPLQTIDTITAPTTHDYTYRWPSQPIMSFSQQAGSCYVAFGSGIYYVSNWTTRALTKVKDITNADMISSLVEYKGQLYAFPECYVTPGNAPYEKATGDPTSGANWAPVTVKAVYDAMVFDDKLLGTALDSTGFYPQIIFTVDGENWNIDLPDGGVMGSDGVPIWQGTGGRIRFIGPLIAPWGEPGAYFLSAGKWGGMSLYCLDFYARKAYEIMMAPGTTVMDACIWNSQVIVTDGYTVYSYTPNGEIIREMGLPRKGGIPPCFQLAQFYRLFAVGPYLYCTVNQSTSLGVGVNTQVWCWNGTGWSPIGARIDDLYSVVAAGFSQWSPVYLTVQRSIYLLGAGVTNTNSRRVITDLPWYADTPTYGVDDFAPGPASFITPWFDGGFHDLDGVLYWLRCAGYNLSSTETVKVEYALDHNETTWVQLRGTTAAAGVFNGTVDTLYFKTSTPVKVGIQFRSVRFRVTLTRRTTGNYPEHYTPELQALTMCYDKKPLLRTAWAINLDVSGMLERPTVYTIGGQPFTIALLWALLKTLWNTETLLALDVPSVSTGMLVKMEALSGTFEDFRASVLGKGMVSITCLEPIDA